MAKPTSLPNEGAAHGKLRARLLCRQREYLRGAFAHLGPALTPLGRLDLRARYRWRNA